MKVIPEEKLIIRNSFALSFNGGEIWGEELDSLSVHKDIVKRKFLKDLETIRRPSSPAQVAVHLKNTMVDEELCALMVSGLAGAGNAVKRVAFVGLDRRGRSLFKSCLREEVPPVGFASAFFDDYEKAKLWLTGK